MVDDDADDMGEVMTWVMREALIVCIVAAVCMHV